LCDTFGYSQFTFAAARGAWIAWHGSVAEEGLQDGGVRRNSVWQAAGVVLLLTLFGLIVHGYHPFAEDGGLYVAGIRKLIDPALYAKWTGFVTEHLRFSLFAPAVAALVRVTHLPLEYVLLVLYCVSIWATLWATWMVAVRVTQGRAGQFGSVVLMACWLTLPVAGTSLQLSDPYLTARSFSTPLVLAAIAWSLDRGVRSWILCGVALLAAAALHPLMAGYGLAAVITLFALSCESRAQRQRRMLALGAMALLAAGALQASAPAESANYLRAVASRAYWFPLQWAWYELFGLVAPFVVVAALARVNQSRPWLTVARGSLALGGIGLLVAACFCHQGFATHLVARLQPLRSLQIVYELMIVLLGAWLGERILKQHPWRWALTILALGVPMFVGQRITLPSSAHLEWPWATPVNPWEQAFLWVRDHTPVDALFALDARYISEGRHEDAQCFRAIAERSALADYSKDGGEASITPSMAGMWMLGQQAQAGLETESDAERLSRLQPLGVTWIVLESSSATEFACLYHNATVKVCRLP
jgi:hypothetical protein